MLISNEQGRGQEGESHEPLPRPSTYSLSWAPSLFLVAITLPTSGWGNGPIKHTHSSGGVWGRPQHGPGDELLQWASDLLPGWFASSSSHLLLLDHHLPVPAIIKVLEIVSHVFGYQGSSDTGKALFCSFELQYYPGWAHSSSGSPATSMTCPRCFLCPAGDIPSTGHSCFPWSTMRQNQVADGAGRLESWGRDQWLAPGTWETLRAGSPTPASSLQEMPAGSRLRPIPWMEGCWWPRHGKSHSVPGCQHPLSWAIPADGSRDASQPGSAWGPV